MVTSNPIIANGDHDLLQEEHFCLNLYAIASIRPTEESNSLALRLIFV